MLKQKIPNSSENRYSDTNTATNTNGSSQYLLNSYYALDTGLTLTTTLPGGQVLSSDPFGDMETMPMIKQLESECGFTPRQSDSSTCSMIQLWIFIWKYTYEACFTKGGRITKQKQLWNGFNYGILEWSFSVCGQSLSPNAINILYQ